MSVKYVLNRFLYMVVTLFVLSAAVFAIIQLPEGDYADFVVSSLQTTNVAVDAETEALIRARYGLDRPLIFQYLSWLGNVLKGDFGRSFYWQQPAIELIGERVGLTAMISFITIILIYAIAIPIGIYSATHQYSVGDYAFTTLGFMGLAVPNFLLALILMWLAFRYLGWNITGLFSTRFSDAPWSFAKVIDMLKHLPAPVLILSTAGTASVIRVFRGSLLDELRKQYVITARAKGAPERSLLFKYPVRVALNPIVASIGGLLPFLLSGSALTSIVLALPTTGPMLLNALLRQDMLLAAGFLLMLGALSIIGTFISDLLLVAIDPRIRFEKKVAG